MGRPEPKKRIIAYGTEDLGGARSPTVPPMLDGPEHAGEPGKCNAPIRRGERAGRLCRQAAGLRTDHPGIGNCYLHGGSTYSHRKAAQKVMAEQMAATYGLPIETTPEEALTQELYRTAGHVAWLGEQIRTLTSDELVWGMAEAKRVADLDEYGSIAALRAAGREDDNVGELYELIMKSGISAWVELYLRERKHLSDVAAGMLKIGIEAKRVESIRRQGLQLSAVVRAFVALLGLTPQQMLEVPALLRTAVDQVMRAPVLDGAVVEPVDQAPESA
jgi:hypothetical protein